jgi:UDP-N-acetylglucosamine/UDP-N-acetylgalactosamine 4-epimerase
MERMLRDNRVLNIEGACFIDLNLVESLVFSDNYIVSPDKFSTEKLENLKGLSFNSYFEFIEEEIISYSDYPNAIQEIEIIFHQGALDSIPHSIKDPVTSTDVYIGGFINMLFTAEESGIKRFFYNASYSICDYHPDLPKIESWLDSTSATSAISNYDDELSAINFASTYEAKIVELRFLNSFYNQIAADEAYTLVIPSSLLHLKKMKNSF